MKLYEYYNVYIDVNIIKAIVKIPSLIDLYYKSLFIIKVIKVPKKSLSFNIL